MRLMNFNAWGTQTRPVAAHSAHFVMKFFHLLHLHTGGHFLLPQRANYWRFIQLQNWMRQMNSNTWDIQTCSPFPHFVVKFFYHFHLHTGGYFLLVQSFNHFRGLSLNSRVLEISLACIRTPQWIRLAVLFKDCQSNSFSMHLIGCPKESWFLIKNSQQQETSFDYNFGLLPLT